jgi:cold shock CspA family protein
MIQKGRLAKWNDDRGFGFIKPDADGEEIFIHVSALRHMARRPRLGDVICYQLNIDGNGNRKAVHASIEGVEERKIYYRKRSLTSFNKLLSAAIILVVVSVASSYYQANPVKLQGALSKAMESDDNSELSCQGKRYCSEMVSCKEAKFYLRNCPGVKIDGDNDGVPCEAQWCN